MPIYDYRCDHCGHVFSAVRSFTDAAIDKCPACGKRPRKLPASLSIVFKGSGWYKTDSRGTAKAGVGDTDAKPAAEAKGAGATTAEAKGAEVKVEGKRAEAKVEGKGAEAKGEGRRADAKRDTKAADARPADAGPAKPAAPPKEAAS